MNEVGSQTHLVEVFKHLGAEFVDHVCKFVGYFFTHAFDLLQGPLLARY